MRYNDKEKFALLMGILLGDGCLSSYFPKNRRRRDVIVITGNLKKDIPFFKEVVRPLLGFFTDKTIKLKPNQKQGKVEIQLFDKNLFYKIYSEGFPIGKKGPNLRIPKKFLKPILLKQVIKGIFATDGSLVLTRNPNKFYPRIEIHLISKSIIFHIHKFLIQKGMRGHFYECKRKEDYLKKINKKYRIQFNGRENLKLFEKVIGLINPSQKNRFCRFIKYDRLYKEKLKGIPTRDQFIFRGNLNSSF